MRQQMEKKIEGNIPAQQKAKYHITEEAVDHLMETFMNQYNDPVWAVLREFLSNALDIHRSLGINTPVDIQIPNMLHDNLVVRDYGTGMTNERFEYLMLGIGMTGEEKYFDEGQIGGFGVGGKCFLAISDMAIFNIVREGKKSQWLCQPNDSDDESTKLIYSDKPVDEPNGMEVRIPIDTNTYPKVSEKLFDLIRYLDYPVRVDGVLYDTPLKETLKQYDGKDTKDYRIYECSELGGHFYLFENVNRLTRNVYINPYQDSDEGDITVVVNGIPYPLPLRFFRQAIDDQDRSKTGFLSKNNLVVEVPDNLFKLAPNREGFIQNRKSTEACQTVYNAIVPVINEEAEKEIKVQETEKQAVKRAMDLCRLGLYTKIPMEESPEDLDSDGTPVKDIPIPFGNGTTSIGQCMALNVGETDQLEADVYIAAFREYKRMGRGPKDQVSLIPIKADSSFSGINSWTRENEYSRVEHLRELCDMGSKIYLTGSGTERHFLIPYPAEVKWVPAERNPRGISSRYLRARHNSYSTYATGTTHSKSWDPESCRKDIPTIVIHGTEEQRDEALKLLGRYCSYDMQDINMYKDIYVQQSFQRGKKGRNRTSSSYGSSNSGQQSTKPRTKWFRFKDEPEGLMNHKNSDWWEPEEMPEEKFLYVRLYCFEPYNLSGLNPVAMSTNVAIREVLTFLQGIEGDKPVLRNVYGIKEADKKKIPSHAEDFHNYVRKTVHKWLNPDKTNKFRFSLYQHQLIRRYPLFKDWIYEPAKEKMLTVFFDSLLEHGYLQSLPHMFPGSHPVRQLSDRFNSLLKMPQDIRESVRREGFRSGSTDIKSGRFGCSVFRSLPVVVQDIINYDSESGGEILLQEESFDSWFKPFRTQMDTLINRYDLLYGILDWTIEQKMKGSKPRYNKKEVKNVLKYVKAMDKEEGRKTV